MWRLWRYGSHGCVRRDVVSIRQTRSTLSSLSWMTGYPIVRTRPTPSSPSLRLVTTTTTTTRRTTMWQRYPIKVMIGFSVGSALGYRVSAVDLHDVEQWGWMGNIAAFLSIFRVFILAIGSRDMDPTGAASTHRFSVRCGLVKLIRMMCTDDSSAVTLVRSGGLNVLLPLSFSRDVHVSDVCMWWMCLGLGCCQLIPPT